MLYHSGALARLGLQDRLPGHVLVQCTLSLSLSLTHTHTHTYLSLEVQMFNTQAML